MKRRKTGKIDLLQQELKQGRGLQHLIEVAYRVLGNPLVMIDLCYRCLLQTDIGITDDALWNDAYQHGRFSDKSVDFFHQEGFVEVSANADVVYLLRSDQLKYDRLCGKLFDQEGLQIGCITVFAFHKPIEQEDYKLVEIICESLSVEIQQSDFYQNIERVFQESVVCDLIEGKTFDRQVEEPRIGDLYANLKPYLYLVVVDITQYEHTLSHLAYFRDLFERIEKEAKSYLYLNNIVMLLSDERPTLSVQEKLPGLCSLLVKHRFYAGISNSFDNIYELKQYYRQALNALNYGMAADTRQHIFRYDDYKVDYSLNLLKHKLDPVECGNPIVIIIREYDLEHGTAYYDLLHAHLLAGNNLEVTARKLRMSSGDLLAQLEEIQEKFAIDWNDGNQLFSIFFTMKLMD